MTLQETAKMEELQDKEEALEAGVRSLEEDLRTLERSASEEEEEEEDEE